LIRLLLFLKLR